MLILRYLVLLAIAALGFGMIVDGLVNTSYRLQGWIGFGLFAAALVVAVVIVVAVHRGRLPLRTWYVVPPLVGAGAAAAAHDNTVPSLVDLGAGLIGMGTVLVAYAGLQGWADRRGGRNWQGLVVLAVVIATGTLLGQVLWLLD